MNSDRTYSAVIPILRSLVRGRLGSGRRQYFELVPVPPGRVLFIGDSITEGGLWADFFPDLATSNRGIGGEATYDLVERIDNAVNDPVAISLMIGTNDFQGPRPLRAVPQIAERADEIVRRIRERAPSALIVLNSVLPRTDLFAARIQTLNEHYRVIAARHGARYLDLWPTFADDAGAIKEEYTRDGLHLTPAGYLAWVEVLRPHLAPLTTNER